MNFDPKVGRVLHYHPGTHDGTPQPTPCAATIAYVYGPNCVNIGYLDTQGDHHYATSVRLIEPDAPRPVLGSYACWPPRE